MTSFGSKLLPAHRGYRYQDIWTAYALVRAVIDRFDRVTVDRKQVLDDRIDDLEIVRNGRKVRQQLKTSQDADRSITEYDFITESSSLRIDRLVLTHVRAGNAPAQQYRLCATWAPPSPDDGLAGLLESVEAEPTVSGWKSRHYRLRGDFIWPTDADPLWQPLKHGSVVNREEFLAFCDRFIIELSLPLASTSLLEVGPLEQALIHELSERIGIGRYPNLGRNPADVAALAISLANLARTKEETLTPQDVERELAIRTDFGRVAQSFPIDETLFYDRPIYRQSLRQRALNGIHQVVVAPPGAGKSWELTRLADELSSEGVIVARHYCYLQPGDELVEKRVTTDVFFGNLLAELIDAAPELVGAGSARYAAGLGELETTLGQAAKLQRPVVLIIDGLDHIARVRRDARSLTAEDTDIVERLAIIDIPKGISLILGSQPGIHLDPLRVRWGDGLVESALPPWASTDVVELAKLHKVPQALVAVGIRTQEEINKVLAVFAERAAGNPLYVRYLARALVVGLKEGTITSPVEWLIASPKIEGEVAVYYEHLYRNASADAQAIADVMAVIDFAVAETDLKEILPSLLVGWLTPALNCLAPILTASSGQGGIRIFHESFRRFMVEELARTGRQLADVLAPVITWLEKRGFYSDAKSFRFLLPALRRAKRDVEALEKVDITFVSTSVAYAHHLDAIQRNIALAADVAADLMDWPSLVRCIELHRAAFTCFDESQNTWEDYWAAYLELFGPASLAERLLFDGRPTQPITVGLYACGIIDDAGGIAPWKEYLEGFQPEDDEQAINTFDKNGELSASETSAIAAAHGKLRLGEGKKIIHWLYRCLTISTGELSPLFLRKLSYRVARMTGPELVAHLCKRAARARNDQATVTPCHIASALLGVADEYVRRSECKSIQTATMALRFADTPELALACVEHGAPVDSAIGMAKMPSIIPIGINTKEFLHTAKGVREWTASVRLIARNPEDGLEVLEAERARVSGVGWYRCWLKFVIGVALAEAAKVRGTPSNIAEAFIELTNDVHPFLGDPRACDLYPIRNVISQSISWGLGLLTTEDEWKGAIDCLLTVCEETASKLDREDGGPLPISTLLTLLLPYISAPIAGPIVRNAVEQEVSRLNSIGSYYSVHADNTMRLVRARLAGGDRTKAFDAWNDAAIYLCGYGWHKDVTIYEVIESIPALTAKSSKTALNALADVQNLATNVVGHTDGRSTKGAPNAWFRALLRVANAEAIGLLAQTYMRDEGVEDWPKREAVEGCLTQVADSADPAILDALYGTKRFEVEYDGEAARRVDERLAPIMRMAANDPELAASSLRRVSAEITGDCRRHTEEAARHFDLATGRLKLVAPHIGVEQDTMKVDRVYPSTRKFVLPWMRIPAFPPNPTIVDILARLRSPTIRQNAWDEAAAWDSIVLALSYHLGQLVEADQEGEARRLLRFFARDVYCSPSTNLHPLGQLAEALDNAGYQTLAAVGYTLAYTSSRGGGGYHCIGDRKHSAALTRGLTLNRKLTQKVLAEEIAYFLRGSWYSIGASRNLIERIAEWGDLGGAEAAWRETYKVIEHRLPLPRSHGWFAPFAPGAFEGWTVDESLAALLLSRTLAPQARTRIAALAGVVDAIQRVPNVLAQPLKWWLTRDIPVTSLLLVLEALSRAETSPFIVTKAISDVLELYAASTIWGARGLSSFLLQRVGISIPPASLTASSIAPDGDLLTPKKRTALLALDTGQTLEAIKDIWPDFPDKVLHRVNFALAPEVQKDRCHQRFRLAFGRDGDSRPATPVLYWESEMLISVEHEELCGLPVYLWSTGQWANNLEENLRAKIIPDIRVHLGLAASRTARPAWSKPAEIREGTNPLLVSGKEDPLFSGWIRFGFIERQYLYPSETNYGPPSEVVTVFAGALAVPPGSSPPQGYFPFNKGQVSEWWSPTAPPPSFPPHLPLGSIVSLVRVTDWLNDAFVLIPPAHLKSYVVFQPPAHGAPLVWADSNGSPAIVARTWRVINPEALFAEPVSLEGSDLLVRPDIAGKIRSLCGAGILELAVVDRHKI